ncbi:MAG TPA: TetR/AcrR family transcriptional regulator [Blastocatellia bacterium]|jgi:TetR/AcrR family transcriptional repressor of nem operon|nr:TetR/AcrR family transcriptional regulator [Blastocatellia bacterium]
MGRHKEFDRDDALHKAMEVFWSRGYEAASIEDLVRHMGINRQSLYDTFGDKHALYLQSLDRYREVEGRKVFEQLERPGSVKKTLRQLFEGVVERALCDEQRRGCFMGNAISELAGRCKETAARTCSNMAAAEDAFYRALLRGKKEGELKGVRDPRAVSRFLCSSLQGLILMARATQDRKKLEDVVKVTLSVLD